MSFRSLWFPFEVKNYNSTCVFTQKKLAIKRMAVDNKLEFKFSKKAIIGSIDERYLQFVSSLKSNSGTTSELDFIEIPLPLMKHLIIDSKPWNEAV